MPIPSTPTSSQLPVVPVAPAPTSAPGPAFTGTAPLVMSPGYPFVLAYHPDNDWSLERAGLDEATWLPRLQQITCMPGVSGATTVKPGENPQNTWKELMGNVQRKGWVIIPADLTVDGVQGYVQTYPVRSKSQAAGFAYRLRWETPRPRRKGQRQRFALDRASYNQWRLRLVELGVVPPMDESMAQEIAKRAQHHASRREAMTGLDAQVKDALLKLDHSRIDAIRTGTIPTDGGSANQRALARLGKTVLVAAAQPFGDGSWTVAKLARLLDDAGQTPEQALARAADAGVEPKGKGGTRAKR